MCLVAQAICPILSSCASHSPCVSIEQGAVKLIIRNSKREQVVVGVRVLLGSAHQQHIPATITLFSRVITTVEGQRRW